MNTMLEMRYWRVVRFGWGKCGMPESFETDEQLFLDRYFPGRRPLRGDGLRIVATEEEVAFCEFDCGAILKETTKYA